MSQMKMFERVADVVRKKGGRLQVNDPDLEQVLIVNNKSTKYRLATYMWEIRTKMGMTVLPIRSGRAVVAYDVPAFQIVSSVETPAESAVESVAEPVAESMSAAV